MNQPTARADDRTLVVLDPRWLIRRIYVGRLTIASAIFLAATVTWFRTESSTTFEATAMLVGSIVITGASFLWTEVNRKPLTKGFLYVQMVVDVLVVTMVVHLTSTPNAGSQFAALYILVNAAAALLLPIGGALLIAALGLAMYAFDAVAVSGFSNATALQLFVFSVVALSTVYISARLQQAGEGREQLVAELTRVRLREKDILENIKSGIVTVDETGVLLFANPHASELLGIDLEAHVGSPIGSVVRGVAPALASSLEGAVRDPSKSVRAEGEIVRADRTFSFGVTTTSAGGDGANVGPSTTAIFQDISDRQRLEQLNLRAQRLEAVAELSASLAHEIKNPLASIRSAVEQLSARPVATTDEKTLGNLIVRESDRLSRLLSEFLDFARVRVTSREPVDIAAVVRGAAALVSTHPACAGARQLDVRVSEEPLMVLGDEDLLHRAVFNLALNAVQASRPNESVRLVAGPATREQLRGSAAFPNGAVAVQVIDVGPGIPAQVQGRLFEPFTTTKTGGSGLGLAIAHRAIESHRGIMHVDSNEHGTRFTVLLPRAEPLDGATT